MPSIYLKCDNCGATYDGEKHHERGFRWYQWRLLAAEARNIGWTGEMFGCNGVDWCPECSRIIKEEQNVPST